MTRHIIIAMFVYAVTLGGLIAYNSGPPPLTESEQRAARHEMKEQLKAAFRDKLERFRTGRLTAEEKAALAADQEKIVNALAQSMKAAEAEVEKAFQETASNEVSFREGGNAIDACLHALDTHDAFLECFDHLSQ
ncbi:hypothetical protein O9X98_06750 [Agrobacterium salinitolerans]|nr:hypothetical protein [Agrobacterium salinitolerans]